MKMNFRILLLVMAISLWACNPGETGMAGDGVAGKSFAVHDTNGGSILNPSGPFMTSPTWLMDGSGIVTRGHGGRGLYILRPDNLKTQIADPGAHGFVHWIREGDAFCMLSAGTWKLFDYNPVTGQLTSSLDGNGTCVPNDDPFSTVRTLYSGPNTQVSFDLYRGRLSVDSVEVEASAAWGVSVSPDGSAVAYATGHLKNPSLFVYDKEMGNYRIASGVHPSWHPDSTTLVYAVPLVNQEGKVAASELYTFNLGTRTSSQLTQTENITEMQPAVSPDGRLIAFADWTSGAIMLRPAGEEVGP